ncbi:hypothetical protein BCV70DRAFT_24372 [Testicularia cyperi]|uniref:Uncharacterized protein n=1 Tax=Testicularia cyperi TaxID=1882483 RepID=A0A317Y2P5_9BASI|nr:hypothetical protein BCV70DRAFT_24372 [Testicularia cyperi]
MVRQQQEVPELSYLPSYTPPQTRPPPPSGPPPAYSNVIRRVYPYSLRPVVILTTLVTVIYLVVVAVANFRSMGRSSNSAVQKILDAVVGALLIGAAVVELLGFLAAFKSNLKMATLYSRLTLPAFALVIAAEIIGIVEHYSFKSRIIDNCVADNTGAAAPSSSFFWPYGGSSTTMSAADAQEYCQSQWKYDSSWEIVWLIITIIVGIPFVMFSFAFVRQLQDPSSVRVREAGGWWGRRNQQPPSGQYGQSGPYDPYAQSHAYAPGSYPPAPYGAYPPPQGPPPPGQNPFGNDRDLPGYERGGAHGDFDDQKSPVSPNGGYGYTGGAFTGRPSTSRDRDSRQLDAAKDSQVTVRLNDDDDDDAAAKTSKTKTNTRDHNDDDTPRI